MTPTVYVDPSSTVFAVLLIVLFILVVALFVNMAMSFFKEKMYLEQISHLNSLLNGYEAKINRDAPNEVAEDSGLRAIDELPMPQDMAAITDQLRESRKQHG